MPTAITAAPPPPTAPPITAGLTPLLGLVVGIVEVTVSVGAGVNDALLGGEVIEEAGTDVTPV